MAKPGPAKTPTAELAKRGSWRAKLPDREDEIQVPALRNAPDPPEWLSDGGGAIWRAHAQPAFAEGLLTALDVMAFGMMCERVADYYQRRNDGDRRGADEAAKSAVSLMDKCGQTVTSRVGLPKPDVKESKVLEARSLFAKG